MPVAVERRGKITLEDVMMSLTMVFIYLSVPMYRCTEHRDDYSYSQ